MSYNFDTFKAAVDRLKAVAQLRSRPGHPHSYDAWGLPGQHVLPPGPQDDDARITRVTESASTSENPDRICKAIQAPREPGPVHQAIKEVLRQAEALGIPVNPSRLAVHKQLRNPKQACNSEAFVLAFFPGPKKIRKAARNAAKDGLPFDVNDFLEERYWDWLQSYCAYLDERLLIAESKEPKDPLKPPKKKATINIRMLEIIQKDPAESLGWTITEWSERLKCSRSSVHGTEAWKNLREMHMDGKQQRARDRRGRNVPNKRLG